MFRTRKSIKTIPYSSTAPKKTNFVGRWDAIVSHQADLYQFRIPSIGLTTTWGTLQNNKFYISTKHKSTRSSTIVKCAEHRTREKMVCESKKKKLFGNLDTQRLIEMPYFLSIGIRSFFVPLLRPLRILCSKSATTPALPRCRFHGG